MTDDFNGEHLKGLTIDTAGLGDPDPAFSNVVDMRGHTTPPDAVEPLDKDDFWEVFCLAFDLPMQFINTPEMVALAIQENEIEQARAASDSIYALLKIWYPSALTVNSPTMMHLLVAVPFLWMKIQVVRLAMAQKNPVTEQEIPPANTPENPVAGGSGTTPDYREGSKVTNLFGRD